jgi:hypothetical protein
MSQSGRHFLVTAPLSAAPFGTDVQVQSSKQPWVTLPPAARAVPEFYELDAVWPGRKLGARPAYAGKKQQT